MLFDVVINLAITERIYVSSKRDWKQKYDVTS